LVHWFGITFFGLILLAICAAPERRGDVAVAELRPRSAAAPNPAIPAEQQTFISIVSSARDQYKSLNNEIQKSQARDARRAKLQSIPLHINGWVGKLVEIDTNSDGLGIVRISIGDDIAIGTWNNALSDMNDGTLIQKGSPVYNSLARLNEGAQVRFSGYFVNSTEDFIKEVSLTQDGSMTDPQFLIRFQSIETY